MEPTVNLANNGQELQEGDFNVVAAQAGLADDRTLWELLRLLPYSATPQKGILTYGKSGWAAESGLSSTALVQGGTASGSVKVMPFRAFVSSTDESTQTEELRGSRSGYLVGFETFDMFQTVAIAANASGHPRWTLVYAAVTPATANPTVNRYVKDPTTKVVSSQAVVLQTSCAVALGTVNGTGASTPTRPALPSDAAGTYYIPLAYLWIPNGFGSISTVNREYIDEVAPVLTLHSALGVSNLQPANQSNTVGGTVDTRQLDATQGYRPGAYLPSTMIGGESRVIPIQLSLSPASHQGGDIVDNSVDWRYRLFRWQAFVTAGNAQANGFVWDRLAGGGQQTPVAQLGLDLSTTMTGQGQSFYGNVTWPGGVTFSAITNFRGAAVFLDSEMVPQLGAFGSAIVLYVDSTTGALKIAKSTSGAPGGQIVIWLDSTAPYSNFGTV